MTGSLAGLSLAGYLRQKLALLAAAAFLIAAWTPLPGLAQDTQNTPPANAGAADPAAGSAEGAVDPEKLQKLNELMDLAKVLCAQGRMSECVPIARQALKLARDLYGNDHINVYSCLEYLGVALLDEQDIAGARSAYEEAYSICLRAKLGDQQLENTLNHLANVLLLEDDLTKARPAFERVIKDTEAVYGANSAELIGPLLNFAHLLSILDDRGAAITQAKRALQIAEQLPTTAPAPQDAKQLKIARDLYRRDCLVQCGVLETNDEAAEKMLVQALQIDDALPEDQREPMQKVEILTNLANYAERREALDVAANYANQALALLKSSVGEDQLSCVAVLNTLGSIDIKRKQEQAAREAFFCRLAPYMMRTCASSCRHCQSQSRQHFFMERTYTNLPFSSAMPVRRNISRALIRFSLNGRAC